VRPIRVIAICALVACADCAALLTDAALAATSAAIRRMYDRFHPRA